MTDPDVTDDLLLEALGQERSWTDAFTVARRAGTILGRNVYNAPGTALVARRLSRLATQGRCEKATPEAPASTAARPAPFDATSVADYTRQPCGTTYRTAAKQRDSRADAGRAPRRARRLPRRRLMPRDQPRKRRRERLLLRRRMRRRLRLPDMRDRRGALRAGDGMSAAHAEPAPEEPAATGGVTGKGWTPGKSGNPGGRPKGLASATREVLRLAVDEGEDPALALARFWASVMGDEDAKMEHRIQAADRLADRGWGKPPAYAPIADDDPLDRAAEASAALVESFDARIDEVGERRAKRADEAAAAAV